MNDAKLNKETERTLKEVLLMIGVYDYFHAQFQANIRSDTVKGAVELCDMLYVLNRFSENLAIKITGILEES